jgi:thiol-disulfide isomerase/thioredoxin
VAAADIQRLSLFGRHRFGSQSELHPQPPLHIVDSDHFETVVKANSDRLIVVDFFATWCGPCKTMTPVFRHVALQTPTALFLKVRISSAF